MVENCKDCIKNTSCKMINVNEPCNDKQIVDNCIGCYEHDTCISIERNNNIGCIFKHYAISQATQTQVGGDHYSKMKIQPIDFILQNKLGFCEGNAIKYICRHRSKNGKQDIEKAVHYLQILLENYDK